MSDIFIGMAYLFAGCGLLILCLGIFTSLREWLFLRNAVVTTGTITDRREGVNPEVGRLYIYDILFKTPSEDERKVSLKHRQEWELGKEVSISYHPQKPDMAMFKKSTLPGLTAFTICGIILLLFGLIFLFVSTNLVSI